MTLYGVGLGPGDADLVSVRGKRVLESVDVVYSPGRLSRAVATEHVSAARLGDLDFPMTRDEDALREAWREAAEAIAPAARDGDAAFVTLGDPNVYSTFGHLRRTLDAFHPDVDVEVVPGISAMTAFATALDVEIEAGAGLALREAAGGAAPTGPDRLVLFKVTDAPETARKLDAAGYDVTFGRRLFMDAGETAVTTDPEAVADRDYYTLAYAERRGLDTSRATDAFADEAVESETVESETAESAVDGDGEPADAAADGAVPDGGSNAVEYAEAEEHGDLPGGAR
ncbi:cobalt-factor II C(20)-methyltransferase [Halorubrum sp. CBA1125]|uniref:cobalt-factor II C(20)-methyltransferase n=1 Tax=Halorubrum sp. CBA1125 TaxID=2668072 RepID=UPI00135D8FFB|nr:cobalt-factor II C(20)-methyltransferase [Halorubrum sp. CBA1125]MUW13301.1 cobalt-factor II C(20)-methyltransferase [Halorubrum sp. CBA1125]